MRRLLLLCWVLLGTSSAAHAEGALSLDASACSEPARSEIQRIANVELRERLREPGPGESIEAQLRVTCAADLVQFELRDANGTEQRELSLAEVNEEARPRLIALGVVELVGDWERAKQDRPPPAPAAAPRPVVIASTTAPAAPRVWRVLAAGLVRDSFEGGLIAAGGRIGVERELARPWSLVLLADFAQGSRKIELGELTVQDMSLSPRVQAHKELGRVRIAASLGPRASLTRLRGAARETAVAVGETQLKGNLGAVLGALAELTLSSRVSLFAGVEGGRELRALVAVSQGSGAQRVGPWSAQAVFGVGVRL